MKYVILLFLQLQIGLVFGQQAGIVNVEFMASGILNGERIAWNSKVANVYVDKSTGIIRAYLYVDNFSQTTENPDFEVGKEKGKNKQLVFSCQLPLYDIKDNNSRPISTEAEMKVKYNDMETQSPFSFTMLALKNQGFSIMGQGYIRHSDLEIEGLKELDNDLYITCRIIGR